MSAPHAEGIVRVAGGRELAWASYGNPRGRPLFQFHGFPGSRLDSALVADAATRAGVRVVGIDRPGYGRSTFQPHRRIEDWPQDVVAVADALGFDRFAVVGVSGGGPYLLACARAIPERITRADIVGGLAPTAPGPSWAGMPRNSRRALVAAGRMPWLAPLAYALLAPWIRRRPEWIVDRVAAFSHPCDRATLAVPELHRALAATFREAFRAGGRGAAHDLVLYSGLWRFRPEEITLPIRLWHGEQDRIVPPVATRRLAEVLPSAEAVYLPDDGHFSWIQTYAAAMLAAVPLR